MKNSLLIIAVLFFSISTYGQEEKSSGVFKSDTTWLEEIIHFPIHFAPDINYEGYEDLRFSKHWRDNSHDEFWCYTFAWHLNSHEIQNVEVLEENIKLYYDGLMKVVNKKKDFIVPETTVLFIKNRDNNADYTGKIKVYDAFNTEEMITLNVSAQVYYCDNNKSTTIVFKLSPQNFNHFVWNRFKEIDVNTSLCH